MLILTTWKNRPLSPEQANRMMVIWGKFEAKAATDPSSERVCWYLHADGTGGMAVDRIVDHAAATQSMAEAMISMFEFLEFDTKIVLELDQAMTSVLAAMELVNGR
jgi:hypothetical protein